MDIEKAIEIRKNLEAEILSLIKAFEAETKLCVTGIDVKTISIMGDTKPTVYGVEAEVKLW